MTALVNGQIVNKQSLADWLADNDWYICELENDGSTYVVDEIEYSDVLVIEPA